MLILLVKVKSPAPQSSPVTEKVKERKGIIVALLS
tara:strand:+ start:1549 stop:1653 length:105 start_codon:yes stop_codon:yes gene_type:complete